MARAQFYDVGIDSQGNAVTTTVVNVYARGTTTPVTIYTTQNGATPKSNPFNATTGFIDFWVTPGEYDIWISDSNSPASFTTRVIGWSSIPHTEGIYYQSLAKDDIGPGYGTFKARISDYATPNKYVSGTSFFKIPFTQEIIDKGGVYNPGASTYYFTAPFHGIFDFNINFSLVSVVSTGSPVHFFFSAYRINESFASSSISMVALQDDAVYMPLPATGGYGAVGNVSRSMVLEMDSGDKLDFIVARGGGSMNPTIFFDPYGSEFSGHPIARLS